MKSHHGIATLLMIGLVGMMTTHAMGHGGGDGSHLLVGYYYGHDLNEHPASPPWPATLLVDTHPWELGNVYYDLEPTSGGVLNGWVSQVPGFEPLAIDEQEFGGHGFYSWLDANYALTHPEVMLHVDAVDTGLQVLNPDTLQPISSWNFTEDFPHTHFTYYVPSGEAPEIGDTYTATFHFTDSNGALADSWPFTLQFRVVPEPASLTLLGVALLGMGRRRR